MKVEAQFEVGEYDVVILSAKDSPGLDTWLKQEKYKIPDGAPLLTTQYLDEAEQLADRIAILHQGRIIANGTLGGAEAAPPPGDRRVRREAADAGGDLPRARRHRQHHQRAE